MPRFAILRHDPALGSPRPLHWDFMLESDAALLTWALEGEPPGNNPIEATQLTDHRLDYLDYQGPVSGNRGTVTRCDSGEFTWQIQTERELFVEIRGDFFRGQVRLIRVLTDPQRWVVTFFADSSATGR